MPIKILGALEKQNLHSYEQFWKKKFSNFNYKKEYFAFVVLADLM